MSSTQVTWGFLRVCQTTEKETKAGTKYDQILTNKIKWALVVPLLLQKPAHRVGHEPSENKPVWNFLLQLKDKGWLTASINRLKWALQTGSLQDIHHFVLLITIDPEEDFGLSWSSRHRMMPLRNDTTNLNRIIPRRMSATPSPPPPRPRTHTNSTWSQTIWEGYYGTFPSVSSMVTLAAASLPPSSCHL